jgi:TolA-binding protein
MAGDKNKLLLSLIGQMQCSYLLNNYREAAASAQKVLQTETVSSESIIDAHYILAKSYYAMDDLNNALREFTITENLTNNAMGAEAKYYLAELAFMMDKNVEAENLVFELVDQYASYDYWVARAFILLSDVYYKADNIFQAKQTLQSVIDNFKGPELGKIARNKLQTIIDEEQTAVDGEIPQQQ